jgi:Holliday junction resolvase RusA-like endonuclease
LKEVKVMDNSYAKVVVQGSPISKSNFKLFNINGRAILPYNSGKYHDRYALYEEEISYNARLQNPGKVMTEALIAVLKVYYKSRKRHPDTNNITKSIFDGIEKSGLIINDAQIRRLVIEESYDEKNPRFELELFGESSYCVNYEVIRREHKEAPIEYELPSNKKGDTISKNSKIKPKSDSQELLCDICGKLISKENFVTADKGKTILCKSCLKNMF